MTALVCSAGVLLCLLLGQAAGQNLIFEDEFDELDFDVWQHERTLSGGGNWEFQIYDNNRSSSYVRDGILYIKPGLTEDRYGEGFVTNGVVNLWGGSDANQCTQNEWYGCERVGNAQNALNPTVSARIRSSRGFNFQYGRVEVRARMPKGDWLWPAIWMLPQWEEYGGWPASGEIDLVESRGNLDLRNEDGVLMGHQHAGQTLHWGPFWPYNGYEQTTGYQIGDFGDSFHVYQLEWTETSITLSIDDVETMSVSPPVGGFWELGGFDQIPGADNPWSEGDRMAPFDRKFYLIFNVAVGGTNGFFGDNWTNANGPKPWINESPTAPADFWNARNNWLPTWVGDDVAMAIDYVRVYDS